jgi:hypothetical protein
MKVYHYTGVDDWERIKMGAPQVNREPSLKVGRSLGKKDGQEVRAVFGLLEPQPDNWINNEEFNLTWDSLRVSLGGITARD